MCAQAVIAGNGIMAGIDDDVNGGTTPPARSWYERLAALETSHRDNSRRITNLETRLDRIDGRIEDASKEHEQRLTDRLKPLADMQTEQTMIKTQMRVLMWVGSLLASLIIGYVFNVVISGHGSPSFDAHASPAEKR